MVSAVMPPDLNTPTDVGKYVARQSELYDFDFMTMDHGALGKGYVNELRKWHKLPIMNADKNDKRGYIELFDGAMANGMIVLLDEPTKGFQEEASELLWKDERKLEEMPGLANHRCDAGLYGWRKIQHYDHLPKEPELEEGERFELNILKSRAAEKATARKYGMSFPRGYR
jgi:hypothetical protein